MASQRILHIGCFADPSTKGGNRVLANQVMALRRAGVHAEILTLSGDGNWRGPVPDPAGALFEGVPWISVEHGGLDYQVADFPPLWRDRFMNEAEWERAVEWGMRFLSHLAPAFVHQHYWQATRFMLHAAQRLGIPTACSIHDFGAGCMRTLLVTGEGKLCDSVVGVDKCSSCVLAGFNTLGKLNEAAIRWAPLRAAVERYGFGPQLQGPLGRRGGVRIPVRERVALTVSRSRKEMTSLHALIVPSPFAGNFFRQFGIPPERVHVLPWFYVGPPTVEPLPPFEEGLRLASLGRISQEKGIDVLLRALERVRASRPVLLHIAGGLNNEYAAGLQRRYATAAGACRVTWEGLVPNEQVSRFYSRNHVAVIPSLCYDNTPASLVEALASARPVICTDVPSMTHLVKHEINGLTFPMGDEAALAAAITRLADSPELAARLAQHTRNVPSVDEYAASVHQIYKAALA
ncbi:MAG TPA: glycosyltransferase [Tepidisphaeraceae bacterium]|jgi:glycosyltransferase involved in cell wall biosynthesis|nr:glycosyltransferase [Tepidisphaeraceae bacterium]